MSNNKKKTCLVELVAEFMAVASTFSRKGIMLTKSQPKKYALKYFQLEPHVYNFYTRLIWGAHEIERR